MNKTYTMEIAGLKRDLPLFPVSDDLYIAAFIMFGDVEITCACAKALLEKAPAAFRKTRFPRAASAFSKTASYGRFS